MSISTQWLPPERTDSWIYTLLPVSISLWYIWRFDIISQLSSELSYLSVITTVGFVTAIGSLLIYESGIDERVVKWFYRRRSKPYEVEAQLWFLIFNMMFATWANTGEAVPILNSEDHSPRGQVEKMYSSVVSGKPIAQKLYSIRRSGITALSIVPAADVVLYNLLSYLPTLSVIGIVVFLFMAWFFLGYSFSKRRSDKRKKMQTQKVVKEQKPESEGKEKTESEQHSAENQQIEKNWDFVYVLVLIILFVVFIVFERNYLTIYVISTYTMIMCLLEVNRYRHRRLRAEIHKLAAFRYLQILAANDAWFQDSDPVPKMKLPGKRVVELENKLNDLDSILVRNNWPYFLEKWSSMRRNLTIEGVERFKKNFVDDLKSEFVNHKRINKTGDEFQKSESGRRFGWFVHYAKESLGLLSDYVPVDIKPVIECLYRDYRKSICPEISEKDIIVHSLMDLPKDCREGILNQEQEFSKFASLATSSCL
ncbi:MAG: hypothetical protein ACXACG_12010 [Candidatus Thorarchaeota archaeon]|jgi:hypothetical protein